MRTKSAGFTLIEIVVTMVILVIIATFAVPSYLNSLQDTRRSEARTGLTALAQAQEQWYANNNTYTANLADILPLIPAQMAGQVNYAYSIDAGNTGTNTFMVVADPQNAQADDTDCDPMTLDQAGNRLPADCW